MDYLSAMGWRILQALVAFMVLSANVHWQLIDNPLVAAVNAGCAAIAVSWLVGKAIDLRRYGWRATVLSREKSSDNRPNRRIVTRAR
jgi:hypothetical protein